LKGILKDFLQQKKDRQPEEEIDEKSKASILQEEQQERFDHDMSILEDEHGLRGERLQKEADREVRTAAEDSLRQLHVIQRGRCPKCGEHLRKHLFASICDACGWHTFDVPKTGLVKVHLTNSSDVVEGERCYVVKTGAVLVLRNDVVIARVPAPSVSWIEYLWKDEEVNQRHKQVVEQLTVHCGWCNGEADPEEDGFHLVHVAFGAAQERYCFCSDECYEAFRKMYPPRVHRDCYDRNCSHCNLCITRYSDEADGISMLAKDYLKTEKGKIKKG